MNRMQDPLVSIVIPVYNGGNYLAEAIDSALAQTYQNVEILVVNDGSDDDGATREIALSYGDRVRYFEKENGGVSTALNLGIAEMKGDYFSWLSHDDLYYPEKIEIEVQTLEESGDPCSIVYCEWEPLLMPSRETRGRRSLKERFDEDFAQDGTLIGILCRPYGCTLLIPRKMFELHGDFDSSLRTTQDSELWLRMLPGKKLCYVPQVLVQARIHAAQQGKYAKERQVIEENEIYKRTVDSIFEGKISSKRMTQYILLGNVMARAYEWRYTEAFEYARKKHCLLEEPQDAICDSEKFTIELTEKDGRICLYCAGKRGRWLKFLLEKHGIKVARFSDSNPEKWGKVIEGIPCVSPADLERDHDTVIVTKNDPDELVKSLLERGFRNVISFDEIEKELLFLPIPKRYL